MENIKRTTDLNEREEQEVLRFASKMTDTSTYS